MPDGKGSYEDDLEGNPGTGSAEAQARSGLSIIMGKDFGIKRAICRLIGVRPIIAFCLAVSTAVGIYDV
jgi:hypothetical protein